MTSEAIADALVGATGFVGSSLARQRAFDVQLTSRTIDGAAGSRFGTIVCAAAPGSMFEANRMPDRDRERIDQLIAQLGRIEAERVVLISTIAVLEGFAAADENSAVYETATPYGVNRRRLEAYVADRFPRALIVRLPALFGEGLKKNFLFDMRNPAPSMLTAERFADFKTRLPAALAALADRIYAWNAAYSLHVIDRDALDASGRRAELDLAVTELGLSAVQFTHPSSCFQFYDMRRLWRDIERALAQNLPVIHLAPPPLPAGDIYLALQGQAMPPSNARVHREDMRTAHASLWGHGGGYIAEPAEVLDDIRAFFAREAA